MCDFIITRLRDTYIRVWRNLDVQKPGKQGLKKIKNAERIALRPGPVKNS